MATSVLLACGLNEPKSRPYIHLSEENGVDGSFLISSILGQRIRIPNSGTILVCLQQNFAHYCNAGIRLGYNLQMSAGKALRVIDVLGDIASDFTKSKWTTATTTTGNGESLIQVLWDQIWLQSSELLQMKSTITIIIDDLSTLLNLGASSSEILRFCYRLKQWSSDGTAQEREEGSNSGSVSIVTKLNSCDVYGTVTNQLSELCDVHIVVERLKSGNFKEVDGKIVVKDTNNSCNVENFNFNGTEKVILYKVLERSIKIFNPGEVGIKL